jgi:hypothetical protein
MKVYDYNQEFGGNYYQARNNDIKTLIKGQFKGDFCRSFRTASAACLSARTVINKFTESATVFCR